MPTPIQILKKKIDSMDADDLHEFFRKNDYTPEMVAALPTELGDKVSKIFSAPWQGEINRLMDNPNS